MILLKRGLGCGLSKTLLSPTLHFLASCIICDLTHVCWHLAICIGVLKIEEIENTWLSRNNIEATQTNIPLNWIGKAEQSMCAGA